MLGISVADAVLVVGLALSIIAAWTGMRAGKAAKQERPPVDATFSVAGLAIADTQALRDHTDALRELADAVRAAAHQIIGERDAERRHEELLAELRRSRS